MKSIILSFFFSWKSNQPILRDKSNKITKHKNSKITQGWIPSQQIWEIRDTFSLIATTSVCTSGSELDSVKCLLQESSAHNQSFKGLCFTHTHSGNSLLESTWLLVGTVTIHVKRVGHNQLRLFAHPTGTKHMYVLCGTGASLSPNRLFTHIQHIHHKTVNSVLKKYMYSGIIR